MSVAVAVEKKQWQPNEGVFSYANDKTLDVDRHMVRWLIVCDIEATTDGEEE